MKTKLLLFGLLMSLTSFSQNVTIPDANFKAYLTGNTINVDTSGDGEIQRAEAIAFTGRIYCPSSNIADLTGIEEFINLTRLDCYDNQLTTLNVTNNVNLVSLNCGSNPINSLDVTANIKLTSLSCYTNQLTSLDVTNNLQLTSLLCIDNQLTNLNITNNINLSDVFCAHNLLSNLDVSNNTNLETIACYNNQISNLDVSNTVLLTELYCSDNQLTSIDVSNNTLLTELSFFSNQIQTLDLSNNLILENIYCSNNQITDLDFSLHTKLITVNAGNNNLNTFNIKNGFNTNINTITFNIKNNSNLTCVTVDDIAYSNANWNGKDSQTIYDTNCGSCIVNIPDTNFKNAILNHTPTIDTDGDGEIQCAEALAVTGILNVANAGIIDTTGLEAFENITRLAMFNNDITSIDLSSNLLLQQLLLESNELVTIDISMLTFLTDFKAHSNLLTSANVANGNNTNMWRMQLQGNSSLTCIQIDAGFTPTTPTWLKDSTANYNTNCGPCIVNIPDTNFKNAILNHTPTIDTDGDGEIQCSEALAVTGILNVARKGIVDTTGLEAFENITRLAMFSNNITSIDLSSNLLLNQLLLETNELTTVDISMLTVLTDFKAHSNLLTSANLANGNNTNMTRMQLQGNASLNCVKIDIAYTPTTPTWLIDNIASYTTTCPLYPKSSSSDTTKIKVLQNDIMVYPNPTRDIVTIDSDENIEKISLFTSTGKLVKTANKTNTINLSQFSKGIYWLVINTESGTVSKKLVKK